MYVGENGLVITGRGMDWGEDMSSNMWVFPRGMERDGAAGENSFAWTSRYGSLVVSAYEMGTADGMNENGLVMNGLYLAVTDQHVIQGLLTLGFVARHPIQITVKIIKISHIDNIARL